MSGTVVILTTGGTIAMRFDPQRGGAVPAVSGKELLEAVPFLADYPVEMQEFANIPSFNLTPDDMLRLAVKVEHLLERPDVAGVVITHGTDILEETAYFLDLYLASRKPVCLTGAMRTASDPSPDGPYNILCAVKAAASPLLCGYGTLIVMNGVVHAARDVTKMHRTAVQTFASPNFGPVARIERDGVQVFLPPFPPRTPLRPDGSLKKVPIIKIYSGMDAALFDAVFGLGLDGLVIETYGLGNGTAIIVPPLRKMLAQGIPVVNTSRVPCGRMGGPYAAEGGVAYLRQEGVIMGGWLNSQKARIKLMLALSRTAEPDALRAFFEDDAAL